MSFEGRGGGVLANMIVLARESRGWTQADLAKATGISTPVLCRYEIGRPVPEDDAKAIAQALRYSMEFFKQDEMVFALAGDFLYRKRAHVPAKTTSRVRAEVNIRRMQLQQLLRVVESQHSLPFPLILTKERRGGAAAIAREVREALRIPEGPVNNVCRAIEACGGVVWSMDFGTDGIDGTNLRHVGLPPMLFVNAKVSGDRHRFNQSHELGHVVMHYDGAPENPEDEANAFAREFLMPRHLIRSDLRSLDLAAAMRLKAVWKVSIAALIVRAQELGGITVSTAKRLYTKMNTTGIRRSEPIDIPFEEPTLFNRLVQAYKSATTLSDEEMHTVLFTERLGAIPVPETAAPRLRLAGGLFD